MKKDKEKHKIIGWLELEGPLRPSSSNPPALGRAANQQIMYVDVGSAIWKEGLRLKGQTVDSLINPRGFFLLSLSFCFLILEIKLRCFMGL